MPGQRVDVLGSVMITEEEVRRILGLRGDGIPILSLYAQVPPGPPGSRELRSRVDSLVSEIRPLTSDESVDRNARLSVRADIERIEEFVAEQRNWRPGTLALFCCSARDIFEEVELPRAVRDRIVLDSTPCAGHPNLLRKVSMMSLTCSAASICTK
jgi:peptide chain release factor subunit 1